MKFISKLQSRFRGTNHEVPPSIEKSNLWLLEEKMGYHFSNISLLELALTHPSYNLNNAHKPNNQRLEFLGDSIFGAILSSKLYEIFPNENEGSLSRKRSFFARGSHLSELGLTLGLNKYIKMSQSEIQSQGNCRPSTMEDAIEAVVGAIFLDGGFEESKSCVLRWIGDLSSKLEKSDPLLNPKGKLQELVQAQNDKEKVRYHLLKQSGPDHAKRFLVEVCIGGKKIAEGKGNSKKQAESSAAAKALQKLNYK